MSLLRVEMRNKKLREAEERKKDANLKYLMRDMDKTPEIEKPPVNDSRRIQFENMQSQVMKNIYYDP